jgi:hypothetical protein
MRKHLKKVLSKKKMKDNLRRSKIIIYFFKLKEIMLLERLLMKRGGISFLIKIFLTQARVVKQLYI